MKPFAAIAIVLLAVTAAAHLCRLVLFSTESNATACINADSHMAAAVAWGAFGLVVISFLLSPGT